MIVAPLRRALLNTGVYAAILFSFFLVVAAYQVRPNYTIPIGTATDGPLLRNFYDAERPPAGSNTPYATYRWSRGSASAIVFGDIGRQDLDVVVSVNGSRPPDQPPPVLTVKAGGATLLSVQPPPGPQDYAFSVSRDQLTDGTLTLNLGVNSFKPQGDERELGIIVTGVTLSPSANPDKFIEPPSGPLVAVTGAVALLALLLALLGWGAGVVFAGSGAVGLMAGSLLAFDRFFLTSRQWYATWLQSLVAAAVVALLCWTVGGWLLARGGVRWTNLQRRSLVTLVLIVFAVRLAGQLHPSIFVYDLGYHANILLRIETGDWLFTTQPAEFGGFGYSTFYLPTPYFFIEPLRWLVGDPRMAIRLLTVAVGTLGVLPLFYLVTRVTRDGRAALITSLLYVTMPMSVIIFSWGITPNIFGEFFALCAFAVAVGMASSLRPTKPAFWVLVVLLTVAILSHPGVLALSTVAFLALPFVWWLGRRKIGDMSAAAGAFGAYAAAALVAIAIYYRHFIPGMLETLTKIGQDRTSGGSGRVMIVGGSVEDTALGLFQREVHSRSEWFFWGLRGFWAEAQAYYRVWPVVGTVFGFGLLSARTGLPGSSRSTNRRRLLLGAVAWGTSVVVLALVGWLTNLYVRYALFALPIIALGTGLLLGAAWTRGRYGKWLVLLLIVFFAVEALAFWQNRINYAFK
ncbi:MAG: hypothetical protein ABI670_08590 [Chloroflexota bacterium]